MKKWIIKGVTLVGVCILIFAIRSLGGSEEENSQTPFAVPESYSCILNYSDARRLNDEPMIMYHVRKVSATQIDLVAQVGDEWQSVIRFNPMQTPPYVAVCEEVDNGVYSPGVMKLTPNIAGGFDFTYLEEGDVEADHGVLRPNWY